MDPITKNPKVATRHFSPAICFQICSWLPAKSVGRFTAVNKTWYAFIKSSNFVYTHLERSISRNIGQNLLRLPYKFLTGEICTAFHGYMGSFDVVSNFELPLGINHNIYYVVVGSMNGLVCISTASCDNGTDYHPVVYLCNPLLRKFKRITGSSCDLTMLFLGTTDVSVGLWYDSAESDYKLIRIAYYNQADDGCYCKEQSEVEVYSLRTDSWRKIDCANLPGVIIDHGQSQYVFVGGCFNWIVGDYPTDGKTILLIMSFDTATEKFRAIELPNQHSYDLVLYNGCLGVIEKYYAHEKLWSLWALKEFGVAEKWVKVYDFDAEEIFFGTQYIKNNEIIYTKDNGNQVCLFDFEKKQSRALVSGYLGDWIGYNESLVDI